MKELLEYREELIARLAAATNEFCEACEAVPDPFAQVEGGWNTHQLAAHTRDVDKMVYGMRIRRTAEEQNPEFKDFDAEAWIAVHYDAKEPLAAILDEFSNSVINLAGFLHELPVQAWSHTASHEVYGSGFTLQTWVERGLAHIQEHLDTVRKAG